MLQSKAIARLKELLSLDHGVDDMPFLVIWESFEEGTKVTIEEGVTIHTIEKGVNDQGKKYVALSGTMPEGSSIKKNFHSDAREFFLTTRGEIQEVVTSVKLPCGKYQNYRPKAHHGFKALVESDYFCLITQV